MYIRKEKFFELVRENFIADFGVNVDFLEDVELLTNKVLQSKKYSTEYWMKEIYNACLKAKNHEYPIEDWFDFVDDGFYEVTPDTMHDTHTAEGCYNWFCDMVKLFADILFEHGIITEEEKAQAYVETKLEH